MYLWKPLRVILTLHHKQLNSRFFLKFFLLSLFVNTAHVTDFHFASGNTIVNRTIWIALNHKGM